MRTAAGRRATRLTVALALACTAAGSAFAQEPPAEAVPAESAAPAAAAESVIEPATESFLRPRNPALPALEILGFDLLLNRFNRRFSSSRDDYDVSWGSIRRNLRSGWGVDDDPFRTNQLGHPYQGSMYHGFARSAGFNYWESLGYTFAGSAAWEVAGEKPGPRAMIRSPRAWAVPFWARLCSAWPTWCWKKATAFRNSGAKPAPR